MDKSFAIALILCGLVLIGSAIMDAVDMRHKLAVAEANNIALCNQIKAEQIAHANKIKEVGDTWLKIYGAGLDLDRSIQAEVKDKKMTPDEETKLRQGCVDVMQKELAK